ncbi:MAG: family 43 glycosylhydrolase [Bacillota bacterium]|nr:family 43 glycosylhydrolase [Bacillota bacterium]
MGQIIVDKNRNPIIPLDYPDPDVIRVDYVYYMVTTTMYFMPGCEILRSYDLVNWEHAGYVYDRLDGTQEQTLYNDKNAYGKGMWAASLRFHKGTFYICFVANDTGKTYLFRSSSIEGPWKKSCIEGFYHDCSLLFDDDGRIYIAYGNKNIYITELNDELTGPKKGGLRRLAVSDEGNDRLGYEGTHLYKINGKYYLFFIHSLREKWRRVEACFVADSLEGEFTGRDVFNEDLGYCGQGVAQGAIVDTPEGKWYAILFQDRGASGRMPVLIPVSWENSFPVLGMQGRMPEYFCVEDKAPEYHYRPLVESDDFKDECAVNKERYGCFGLKSAWQFNHEPDLSLVQRDLSEGILWITTDKLCKNLTQAKNTLTQRMLFPGCEGEVTVEAAYLKEGDYAGICAFQSCYGMAALTRRDGRLYVVMKARKAEDDSLQAMEPDTSEGTEWELCHVQGTKVRLKVSVNFADGRDQADFFYLDTQGKWRKIGITQNLYFKLDFFTGCRFGLFVYATKETGGKAGFADFKYIKTV